VSKARMCSWAENCLVNDPTRDSLAVEIAEFWSLTGQIGDHSQ